MLQLKKIVKDYVTGAETVHALKGVSINFRANEFVSILGQSGCGKTTMLNIIGGLDQYTSGDLVIKGQSTKKYKDKNWDAYRNHSIGFVFQSYNLIMHQSVLSNVELALTLSGVSKAERRRRAKEVLTKVGLGKQMNKKPNQMSGGQMQRVAIARALINDPEILLADEPTGALDTETSVQIMDLLKEIAKDRLVIMVTHNPELAEQYSTRIIKLLDGEVIDDSNPFTDEEADKITYEEEDPKKNKHNRMSYFTALGLSFNNLLTKKGRTLLTAFAGSIGIIGIALILSLSSGFRNYISNVEEDTLSTYPLEITDESIDMTSMLGMMSGTNTSSGEEHDKEKVYSNNFVGDYMNTMMGEVKVNDMVSFKDYIENGDGQKVKDYSSDIMYTYGITLNAYKPDTSDGVFQVNPSKVMDKIGMGQMADMSSMSLASSQDITSCWSEMIQNEELFQDQYDLVAGKWPENYDEIVLNITKNNEITDYELYTLGIRDVSELQDMITEAIKGGSKTYPNTSYTYDELLKLSYTIVPSYDMYQYDKQKDCYVDMSDDAEFMKKAIANGVNVKIVGIIRPSDEATVHSLTTTIGYRHDLVSKLMNDAKNSEIGKKQIENPDINIFTGFEFGADVEACEAEEIEKAAKEMEKKLAEQFGVTDLSEIPVDQLLAYMGNLSPEESASFMAILPADTQAAIMKSIPEDQLSQYMEQMGDASQVSSGLSLSDMKTAEDATYDDNLISLGIAYENDPKVIRIFPKDFDAKEKIIKVIKNYNKQVKADGHDEKEISYTDLVGTMMSSVSTIINAISYVLMAFVAISLIVSSIMIGIITYISVLERTKEIGVLRSIGASKRDISRVFNAETIIIGFTAGLMGIVVTIILNFPINRVIEHFAGLKHIAKLPWLGGIALIVISVILTMIAGLIPSRVASKKDPVVALRSE